MTETETSELRELWDALRPGDPRPPYVHAPLCWKRAPDGRPPGAGPVCSRHAGHGQTQHVACGPARVYATWQPDGTDYEEKIP